MRLLQDVIDGVDKVIMQHPSVIITTVALIIAVGCFRYYLLYSGPMRNTGSRLSLEQKVIYYKQEVPLEGIPKESQYRNDESEDGSREAVTSDAFAIPWTECVNLYNCWSWAINPINGLLADCQPIDGIRAPLSIDVMRKATIKCLNVMRRISNIKGYSETQNHEEVKGFMSRDDIQDKHKLIIGHRVIKDAPPFLDGSDYHYIRWYFGQWSAKCGYQGILVKSAGYGTYNIEPETMWAATRQRPNEPGSVYLRWKEDNQVHREAIYKGPTTYYLITLSRPFPWLLPLKKISASAYIIPP